MSSQTTSSLIGLSSFKDDVKTLIGSDLAWSFGEMLQFIKNKFSTSVLRFFSVLFKNLFPKALFRSAVPQFHTIEMVVILP